MAAGAITVSGATVCEGTTAVATAVNTFNLDAATDTIHVVPVSGRDNVFYVFYAIREA